MDSAPTPTLHPSSQNTRILVFIPMYNCAAQVGRVVRQCELAAAAGVDLAVLMIDNRSTDATLEVAQRALSTTTIDQIYLLKNNANYGLGGSHKVAIAFARDHGFAYLVVLHGDDQGALADMVPMLRSGEYTAFDALLGARFQTGARLQGYSTLRTLANRAFNLIFSAVARRWLYDLGSGLNLFRTAIFVDGFHLRYADDLTFNYYLVLGLVGRGCNMRFFPISWREDDQVSNARLLGHGLRMLRLLIARIVNARAFFAAEHRAMPRDDYPATLVYQREANAAGLIEAVA